MKNEENIECISPNTGASFDQWSETPVSEFRDSLARVSRNSFSDLATVSSRRAILLEISHLIEVNRDEFEKIIINENPDYISLSFGGQTALNCGIKLNKLGILYKYKVQVVGTSIENIMNTEDRERFASKMATICQKVPISKPSYSIEEAINVAEEIGYPVLCRAAYALGGLGSGFCNNKEELVDLCLK